MWTVVLRDEINVIIHNVWYAWRQSLQDAVLLSFFFLKEAVPHSSLLWVPCGGTKCVYDRRRRISLTMSSSVNNVWPASWSISQTADPLMRACVCPAVFSGRQISNQLQTAAGGVCVCVYVCNTSHHLTPSLSLSEVLGC